MTDRKLTRLLGILLGILIAAMGIFSGTSLLKSVSQPTPSPVAVVGNRPPEIIGFTTKQPGSMFPGARMGIQVEVNRNGHKIDSYWWAVRAGEGSIVSGQETPLITYEAPETPGIYEIQVQLEYEGGPPVEGSTMVEVVPEPTPTLTDTPTPTPTDTPPPNTRTPTPTGTPPPTDTPTPLPDAVVNAETLNLRSGPGVVYDVLEVLKRGDPLEVTGKCPDCAWLKVITLNRMEGWAATSLLKINLPLAGITVAEAPPTPTPRHTPTPITTPTPKLLPPPIPLEPENGAAFIGGPVILKWQWDYRPRAPNEIFSLRVRREGEAQPCHHYQPRDPEYWGDLTYCSEGKHYWNVALVRELCRDCPEEERWETLSESSQERWIYYVPGEEPWTWPTPSSEGDDNDGGKDEPPMP